MPARGTQTAKNKPFWKQQWFGTLAQWAVVCTALSLSLAGRFSDHASQDFALRVDKRIDDRLGPTASSIGSLTERIAKLEGKMEMLRLKSAASDPTSRSNIKEATEALASAKQNKLPLDPGLFKETGSKFISAAAKQPEAWRAVQQYLAYRSFLNTDLKLESAKLEVTTKTSTYRETVTVLPDPQHPELHPVFQLLYVGGHAAPEESARLERLDSPQPVESGLKFFLIDGGHDTIVLDGEYMKNVIIRNADVKYDGGPVVLENVYFLNCTFVSFRLTPNSSRLSEALLASAPTAFKADRKVAQGDGLLRRSLTGMIPACNQSPTIALDALLLPCPAGSTASGAILKGEMNCRIVDSTAAFAVISLGTLAADL